MCVVIVWNIQCRLNIFLPENIQSAEVIVGWKLDKKLIYSIIYQYKNKVYNRVLPARGPYFYVKMKECMCVKKGESSVTSLVSAFSRAYHSEFDNPKIFDDYVAKEFISQKERNDIEMNMVQEIHFFNTDIAKQFQDNPQEILKWITQVQLSPTPLARAAYCERVLLHEITLGTKQYVILGAGLDTFSFRHRELESNIEIFEVDHPSTQGFKKERIKEAELEVPNNLHFISMDFTKGFSYEQLRNEGFEHKKTFFSLLGVSYYLTKEELSSLIECLFEMVSEGALSFLIIQMKTYLQKRDCLIELKTW